MSTKSTTAPKPACAPSATPPDAASCPDPGTILSLFSGRTLSSGDFPLLLHLSRCRSCQAALAFTAAATAHFAETAPVAAPLAAAAEESDGEPTSDSLAWDGFRAALSRLAPFAAATLSRLATPAALVAGTSSGVHFPRVFGFLPGLASTVFPSGFSLRFRANGPDTSATHWTAVLRLDRADIANLAVAIELPNRPGVRVDGTFTLCGISVPVADGHAALPLEEFRLSHAVGGVSFAPAGSAPVPGTIILSP